MTPDQCIRKWFAIWEQGNFEDIPITEDFSHTSPYGTIKGKQTYLDLVSANKEQFLGHKFEIHDIITEANKACIRYTSTKGDFTLDVSEWHYYKDGLIQKIIAHYHIGEIRKDKTLDGL